MDRLIGRMLDNRYEILEVIGTGGMAVVYKAKYRRLTGRLFRLRCGYKIHIKIFYKRRRVIFCYSYYT